ncbi:MAG TPA: histidine ammonia-lyase [Thermomicrobiaceae bacterium]|nr:histidine ammonia-lyase [Thermomicrobiaceae bacterium]
MQQPGRAPGDGQAGHAAGAPRAIRIDGEHLTLDEVVRVARQGAPVALAPVAGAAIAASRALIERILAEGTTVYGVNTGFGELSRVSIPDDQLAPLQRNLLRSHAAGTGPALPRDVVRAMLLLRANALAKGYSGVRPVVVERLLDLLNAGVTPQVPAQGSVGASGDLAPLAHLSLVLIGEGVATLGDDPNVLPGTEALARAGLEPLSLSAKEGLALINGTQQMTAIGVLALHDAEVLLESAEVAAATSLEALRGTDTAFDAEIQAVRPQPGQARVAARLRALLAGSEILASHRDPKLDPRVQDPYSLRCTPQVLGASWDALGYVRRVLEIECNSATDNPLVFPGSGRVLSGGNFHGQPVALALDFLKLAVAEAGSISERRTYLMLDPARSGLPPFLAPSPGIESGFMVAQYTAAALVSENKVLAHPACVDSIPTSAGMEDHVSMGPIAARGAAQIIANVTRVVAIELLCGAQGVEQHAPLRAGRGVVEAVTRLRAVVPPLTHDRPLAPDIEQAAALIAAGEFRLADQTVS